MGALKVGIAGLGTVAQGVVQTLQRNANLITSRAAGEIRLTAVASRSAKPEIDLHGARFSTDLTSLVGAPDVDVVVELLGGEQPALDLCRAALAAGQHVVTANKALIAHHGVELHELAARHSVSLAYEAAVAGAIPVLGAIGRGLAGNQVEWLAGIINGTSNFILTAMAGGSGPSLSFAEALSQAQELGYAEADPTFDVEGIDAAHKLAILTSLAFGAPLNFPAVFTEGISEVTVEDIEYAAQLGYVIKHLGIARQTASGIEARVHPALVPAKNLLAQVDGVMNAVMVGADGAGATMYYGAGAGMQPTASAVVADLVDIALNQVRQPAALVPVASCPFDYLGIEDIVTSYYLSVPVHDRSGVFAQLTTALSELGISIEAAVQREHTRGAAKTSATGAAESVPIVLLTQDVTERTMQAALTQLQGLPEVAGRIRCIRVESLDA